MGIYTYATSDNIEKTWYDKYYFYAGEYVNYKREGEGKAFNTIRGGGYTMDSGVCKEYAPDGRWDFYTVGSRVFSQDTQSYEYNKSDTGYSTYSMGIANGPLESIIINPRNVERKYAGNFVNGEPDQDISEEFTSYFNDFRGLNYDSWDELRTDYFGYDEREYIYYYVETEDGYLNRWTFIDGDKSGFKEFAKYAPRDY